MTHRLATIAAASLTALVLLAVPAMAGSSFTSGAEAPADTEDHELTLTITQPESEDYGMTARVTATAPVGFTISGCGPLNTWQCSFEGSTVTFTRRVTSLGSNLRFSVHTPETNGTYTFQVTQADGAEEPTTVGSSPTVTVTGGADPPPQDDSGGDNGNGGSDDGSDASSSGDSGSAGGDTSGDTDDTSDSEASSNDTAADADGASDDADADADDSGTSTDDSSPSTSSDGEDGASGSAGGATPRSTEGRSNGTSLQITPRESTADDPAISAPDVADDPAIAPPSDGDGTEDAETGTATMTAIEGQADDDPGQSEGLPWQQLLGAALLVAGGAVVAVRRWDVLDRARGWDPLGRIRRWRS